MYYEKAQTRGVYLFPPKRRQRQSERQRQRRRRQRRRRQRERARQGKGASFLWTTKHVLRKGTDTRRLPLPTDEEELAGRRVLAMVSV